jgi:hypothetical protein
MKDRKSLAWCGVGGKDGKTGYVEYVVCACVPEHLGQDLKLINQCATIFCSRDFLAIPPGEITGMSLQ